MASATQIPPAPPMPPTPPPRPPRSLAGPVVLIVIGILFLLGNLRIIEVHELARWFAHYWPVLLILWGIIKLVEYQQANRAGVRPRGIGAGGVLLIIFLVVAGLIATQVSRVDWPSVRDQIHMGDEDFPWWGHSYEFDDSLQQAFPAGDSLRVTNGRGAINLSASNDNQIHVTVHKRINADGQEQADKWNQSTRPQISASGQILTVNANTGGAGDHWISSDLDIALPRKASVMLATKHGDISIMGRDGNADVTSDNGDVSITDINGNLKLNLQHSSARISQISSDVSIQGRANDVSVEDVKGTVHLDGDFMESVKLARVAKPVSFKSSRTDMDFSQLTGYLNLDSGDLEGNNIIGPFHLRTRSKDVMLNGISNEVRIENENGAVEIHANKLGGIDVRNSNADIRVFVPERLGFQVNAQAQGDGEIRTDFNQIKIDRSDGRTTATGTVNGGGPRILLNNEHGSIEIRKGSTVPVPPPPPKTPDGADVPEPTEN